jgi:UDP-glucuronate 4-epimerase
MTILVTGAAGFIGSSVSRALLERGTRVIGLDNLDPYYDVKLKQARLDRLAANPGFTVERMDVADGPAMLDLVRRHPGIEGVVHLAAQAGVRYSLINPYAYVRTNVQGHLALLEACRTMKSLRHLVFASTSAVYGANTKLPFATEDRVDSPISVYAATKRSAELLSHTYAHLFAIPQTGLRFFTVYGPWGRPDMAAFIFTRKILAGEPIDVFNNGDMRRDFTYIDDITAGVVAALDRPPAGPGVPLRLYNLGNSRVEPLMRFIEILQDALGKKADIRFGPMQAGDVQATYADIGPAMQDLGFAPSTSIAQGLPRFVEWYRSYYGA